MEFITVASQAVLFSLCAYGIQLISTHQPQPYMDEIFHIPQAQKYCNGSFREWNPMITTLPGLYLFSVGLLSPFAYLMDLPLIESCSVPILRLTNIFFCMGNMYVLYCINTFLNRSRGERYCSFKAAVLSLMPVLFFFNFLYYTDTGSAFFVLYAYYLHLRRFNALSSLIGMIALLFRQTNIIWIFFMALCNVAKIIHKQSKLEETRQLSVWAVLTRHLPVLILNTISECWSSIIVGMAAVAFFIWNGSIVVGDKTSHEAAFHPVQICYFSTLALGFSLSHVISFKQTKEFFKFVCNNKTVSLLLFGLLMWFVHSFTLEHPYLLADNRHYPFYIWSKFYRRYSWFRYAIVPLYFYALFAIDRSIQHVHLLIRVCLWVCIALALVPQKLLEFRYFIVPYIFIRLHMKNESWFSLLTELFLYVSVNIFTFYMFLYKPIFWSHIHEPQRIMW